MIDVELLRTGDILHCSGNRILSKLIKKFTGSKFSHTALFIEIWGQPYVIDAQADGVNVRPFYEWNKKYDYDIVAHRFSGELDRVALSKRAMTKVGHTSYDIESLLLRQPHKLVTGEWKEKEICQRECTALSMLHGYMEPRKHIGCLLKMYTYGVY